MSDDEELAFHYRAVFADGVLLFRLMMGGLATSAVLLGFVAIFGDAIRASGASGIIHSVVVVVAVALPVAPIFLTRAKHLWRLYADRLEIEERPTVPLLIHKRDAVVPFADIRSVSMTERFGGVGEFELETRSGQRYRLVPETGVGPGRVAEHDHSGFSAFLNRFQNAVAAAGVEPPPLQPRPGMWSSWSGVFILALATAFGVIGVLFGLWGFANNRPDSGRVLFAGITMTVLAGGFLIRSWRAWQARRHG